MTAPELREIEAERLRRQAALDAACPPAERNRLGQFATPPPLARQITAAALEHLPAGEPIRFLEPALGTGAFYSALLDLGGRHALAAADGVEADPAVAGIARELWAERGLSVRTADFTAEPPPASPDARCNLLLANPPYVRHHHLSGSDKSRIRDAAERASGVRLSGLAGLYCYFILLAHRWLAPGAISAWLVPSEFFDVNYGAPLKQYLLDRVSLLRLHRFSAGDGQFADALVSSAVLIFRNAPPEDGHMTRVSSGGDLAEPRRAADIPINALKRVRKWTALPDIADEREADALTIGRLFDVRRGIVTGGNSFFVLDREEAARWDIPREFLTPILPPPRDLAGDVVDADEDGLPKSDEQRFLIDCPLPRSTVQHSHPALWAYLSRGEPSIAERYLCRSRTPWYRQERRPPAPLLCTYMGRSANGAGPFRFIRNHSRATVANVYLALYPRPRLREIMEADRSLIDDIWRHLACLDADAMIKQGRVYGGGLHKIEPAELARVPIEPLPPDLRKRLASCTDQGSLL